jgi:polar amino acid transport system substrate-binding protein
MDFRRILTVLALLLTGAAARAQEKVTVFTYNDRVPFVLDKDKQDGLEYRLIDWLNKESAGLYQFTLKVVTAPEAKAMVEANQLKGVLLGVNPVWFPPAQREANLWTAPILWDSNLVISLETKKIEYEGPGSLEGLRLAGVKGFAYPALTAAIAADKIKRVDNGSEILALKAVAAGAADVAIVSEWTFLYATLKGDLAGNFHQSNKPFLAFERRILVPQAYKAVQEHLNKVLAGVKDKAGWQKATSL